MIKQPASLTRLLLGVAVVCSVGLPVRAEPVSLVDVLDSVERHFPVLLAAREQFAIAEGELLAAQGLFDVRLEGLADVKPRGFYQTEKFDLGATQPTTLGGLEIAGGYRIGTGNFAEWNKAQQTNEGGELRVGFKLPLLRGREIDERRVELWSARLEQERAGPDVATATLEVRRDAALSYWRWVAAGEKLRIADHLLKLAEDRQATMQEAVREGLIAQIELADNKRLIAQRRAIRISAERGLERQAIALSLYFRDPAGQPLEPAPSALPAGFPDPPLETVVDSDETIPIALAQRPELRELDVTRQQLSLGVRKARNEALPRLDLRVEASQDLGAPVDMPNDKGEFVFQAGVRFILPVQRRTARGTLQKRRAELVQLEQESRLQRDEISVEVRDAVSAKTQAWRRIAEAQRSLELAEELESAERFQLDEGNSDLLRLNIRERETAQAAAFLVEVVQEYFEAWTLYQVALGNAVDPGRLIPPSDDA